MGAINVIIAIALLPNAQGILKILSENGPGDYIKCDVGKVLTIKKASFGDGAGCRAENSLSEVKRRCEAYASCFLEATNTTFGEPCPGKLKKLFVDYECIQPGEFDIRAEAICLSEIKNLTCPPKSRISVLGSNFGRMHGAQCVAGNYKVDTCMGRNSYKVRRRCNNKQSCLLKAQTRSFGNPCPNSAPFLEIKYRCIPQSKTEIVCEDQAKKITCESPQFKLYIKRARFGRKEHSLCQGPTFSSSLCDGSPKLVTSKLRLQCQGRNSCYLWASNLLYGDPCRAKYKYLSVTYSCY